LLLIPGGSCRRRSATTPYTCRSACANGLTSNSRGLSNKRVSLRRHASRCGRRLTEAAQVTGAQHGGECGVARRAGWTISPTMPSLAMLPTYSVTEEDVALRSASTGLGAHTSRYAASGGNAAIRCIGARLRRTCRVLLHRWLRGWLH
jgi:hypothetical protein